MRRLFAVLIVIAVVVVGIGFLRGWFTLSSPGSDKGSNQVNVNLATDTGKIKEDAEIVKDKAAELTGSVSDQPAKPDDGSANQVLPTNSSPDLSLPKAVETRTARGRNH